MKVLKYAPTVYTIAFVEVGDYYTETVFAARSRKPCTLEEAIKEAKDAGYQVIEDLCTVVPTAYEVEITIAVEPEYIYKKGRLYIMVKGGITCYGCDLDYTEGYWLKIKGEEEIFFCEKCAEKAGIVGKPGVYKHEEEEEKEMKSELTHEEMLEAIDEGKTVYLVQMVKGTDNTYDETSEPRTLLRTLSKQKALDFYETLPEWIALEEPETDLKGNEKYESPIVVEVSLYNESLIRG